MKKVTTIILAAVAILWLFVFCGNASAVPTENTLIGKFTTDYSSSGANRASNIELAAKFLDGAVIPPCGILSFNEVVGERTELRGFKSAHVIFEGKFIDGVGGGVCQVSTTLYNAAIRAGLDTDSQCHSLPVSYVAIGFDAMVSQNADLWILNPFDSPATIRTECKNKKLTVKIYGEKNEWNTGLKFSSETVATYKTDEYETVYIDELAEDGTPIDRIVKECVDGKKVETYTVKTVDGKTVKTKLRTSYYRPQKGIKEVSRPKLSEPETQAYEHAAE